MKCIKCGAKIDDGDKFCINCGEPVIKDEGGSVPTDDYKACEDGDDVSNTECDDVSEDDALSEDAPDKFCMSCGAPIEEGDRFCINCGEPVMFDDEDTCDDELAFCDDQQGAPIAANPGYREEQPEGHEDKKHSKHVGLIVVIVIAVVLIVGAIAVAKSGALHKEETPKSGKTKTEATIPDYKSAYKNLLATTDFADPDNTIYVLYDMNKDGVEELIINSGTCEADKEITIYSMDKYETDPQVEEVGSFAGGHAAMYGLSEGEGLIVSYCHMGYEEVLKATIDAGVNTETIIEGHEVKGDYTIEDTWTNLKVYAITNLSPLGGDENDSNTVNPEDDLYDDIEDYYDEFEDEYDYDYDDYDDHDYENHDYKDGL